MRLLGFAAIFGVMLFSSALLAFDQPDDPSNVMTPKRLNIQLCSPTADAGAGCSPAARVSKSTTYGVRNGINGSIATVRYGISELAQAPRVVRESLSTTAEAIRNVGDHSIDATDSMFAVLYSMTTAFLRTASSLLSALVSAIWPF